MQKSFTKACKIMAGRAVVLGAAAVLLACGACNSNERSSELGDSLTQGQRDSIIGASGVPGAKGIGDARRISDSLNARPAPDSLDRDP